MRQSDVDGAGPLSPYRVLDLTGELGWLCGKVLADWGADVIKIEPPGGDPGRRQPPTVDGPEGPVSLAWLAFNAGKRGIVLDLEVEGEREQFLALVGSADFVIESCPSGRVERHGLSFARLRASNRRIVLTSITPYGRRSRDADAPASDLEIMAAAGAASLTGDADRPPVRISQPQAACWASLYAAVGTLIAHHHRQLSGAGQHVDVSAQAAVVTALAHAPSFFDLNGDVPGRHGAFLVGRTAYGTAIRNIWPCRDGHICFSVYGGSAGRTSNRRFVTWMAERELAPDWLLAVDWDAFDITQLAAEQVRRLEEAIEPFLQTLTRREFLEGAAQRRILGYPVARVDDLAGDPQLAAREVWQDVDDPTLGRTLTYPTGVPRFGSIPPRIARPAPRLGEHDAEVLEELASLR